MARFADASEEEIQRILEDRDSKNTKNVIKTAENIFLDFLLTCNLSLQLIVGFSCEELNELLRKFYCAVRKKDGSLYAKKSLISIRYGLQKVFEKSHNVDIVNNSAFKGANDVFYASMVKIKKGGTGEVKHKEVINEDDIKRLYMCENGVFDVNSPKTLQQKVFFEIMLYFCNRGRENLRKMEYKDYEVHIDTDGRRFVSSSVSRLTKNLRGTSTDDDLEGGRMYEQPGNPTCPVTSFEKYISKLNPGCLALWQRPKVTATDQDNIWYDNMVLGKNTLGTMMQKISTDAGLGCIYSNHCIRATCITMLDTSGYESRHIIGISKHRSESSLKHYSKNLSATKKREMSDSIACKISAGSYVRETSGVIEQNWNISTNDDSSNIQNVLQVDNELAAVLADESIFNVENISPSPPKNSKQVYSFHGCNITINNY